jgi:death-on-curing protein
MSSSDSESGESSEPLTGPLPWLSFEDVVEIHTAAMRLMDEPPRPVIDEARLRSKLARPINAYHYEEVRDPFLLGAMLAVAVSQAHGFEDGNKRTALACLTVFLGALGYQIDIMDESVGQWLIAIAEAPDRERDAKTEEFAAWLWQATSRTA